MAVITISRQMGSMGCEVAEAIARCLDYRVVWREVINEAATRAGVPEVALATIDELDLLGLRPSTEDVEAYHLAVREIMNELYQQGSVVIVGRAGQVILQGKEGVLHVRVVAPYDLRVQRISDRYHITQEVAHKQVKISDQSRNRYLKRFYNAKLDDLDWYDLLINTAHFTIKEAASIVCRAVEQRQQAQ